MKLTYSLSLVFLFAINLSFAQSNQQLKDEIVNLLAEQKLSGAVWSIVSEDGKIITDAYGSKNIKTKQTLRATDKVHVGSVSKTILAAGLLRMATLGLFHLDDSIEKYLSKLPVHNQFNTTDPITIRHLIDHTSGLTDAKLWHIFSTTANPDTPLEAVYLNSPSILTVQSRPGSIYSYSNLGYTILGMVIQKISKTRYEDYLSENLLKPLGMVNSSFQFIAQATDKDLAFGHFDNGESVAAMPMYLRPAGQFTTTAEDVGKFLKFMMSDGKINGKPFISTKYLSAVGRQERTDAFRKGVPFGDALGAYSRDRYGVVGIAKNGNILGFSAMIYMFSRHKKAFFIAFNMDSETANYDLFNEVLVKHLDVDTSPFVLKEKNIEKDVEKWEGYYIPFITKIEPFGLLDVVFSHTKVELLKTTALLSPFQGKSKTLIYQGNNQFSMKDRTNLSHVFYMNKNGDLLISDGVKTLKKIQGLKILGITLSLFLGITAIIYLFVLSSIDLIRYQLNFKNKPHFWVFIAILFLVISIIAIAAQPFMNLGNFNLASMLLFLATLLLPIFSILSIILTLKNERSYLRTVRFWAMVFMLQFCALLMMNNLLPVTMWK